MEQMEEPMKVFFFPSLNMLYRDDQLPFHVHNPFKHLHRVNNCH